MDNTQYIAQGKQLICILDYKSRGSMAIVWNCQKTFKMKVIP